MKEIAFALAVFFATLSEDAGNARDIVYARIDTLDISISTFKNKISVLEANIESWKDDKTKLWTRIDSFFSGDNSSSEENGGGERNENGKRFYS